MISDVIGMSEFPVAYFARVWFNSTLKRKEIAWLKIEKNNNNQSILIMLKENVNSREFSNVD